MDLSSLTIFLKPYKNINIY